MFYAFDNLSLPGNRVSSDQRCMFTNGYIPVKSRIAAKTPLAARCSAIQAVWHDIDVLIPESDPINAKNPVARSLLRDGIP